MNTARPLPYELAFEDPEFEATHFPAITEEAEARGATLADPEQFLELTAVGKVLRTVLEEGDETAVAQFGALFFQGFQFWRFQKHVFELDEQLFRDLVGDFETIGAWQMVPPTPAGYLRVPRNLLWARIAEGERPEAVDGMFWTMVGTNDPLVPPFARFDVLLVLGLLPGRPGFSVAEVSVTLGDEPHGHWGDIQAREEGERDFANNLPGGDMKTLHALETGGEVLKLLSRLFWYIAENPDAQTDG